MLGPNNLCLCCGTMVHASFKELVEAAVAGGFDALSIWPQHYEGAHAAGLSDADMRLMLESHGLVISELDPLITWIPSIEKTSIDPAFNYDDEFFFRIADKLGARSINACYISTDIIDNEIVAEAFGRLCDRAAQHGLKVSLEFLPWASVSNITTAMKIVQLADRPNGGIMLDTWHHFRSGGSAKELLAMPGKAIAATQFNDAAPVAADDLLYEAIHERLLPGEGVIDLVEIIRDLDAIGSTAPIGVEVFSDRLNKLTPIEAARKASDAMRTVLDRARHTEKH